MYYVELFFPSQYHFFPGFCFADMFIIPTIFLFQFAEHVIYSGDKILFFFLFVVVHFFSFRRTRFLFVILLNKYLYIFQPRLCITRCLIYMHQLCDFIAYTFLGFRQTVKIVRMLIFNFFVGWFFIEKQVENATFFDDSSLCENAVFWLILFIKSIRHPYFGRAYDLKLLNGIYQYCLFYKHRSRLLML